MTVTADEWLAVCGRGAAGAIAGELSGIRATLTHDHKYPWELQHGKLNRPGVRKWLTLPAVTSCWACRRPLWSTARTGLGDEHPRGDNTRRCGAGCPGSAAEACRRCTQAAPAATPGQEEPRRRNTWRSAKSQSGLPANLSKS